TGKNYGLELTVERFFAGSYYFLYTASVYDSWYTLMNGTESRTRYAANYATNFLAGKEFKLGEKEKGKSLSISAKVSLLGGNRYMPINLEQSIEAGYTVRDETKTFTEKGDDVFLANLIVSYRRNVRNTTRELKIDIQNVTNNKAVVEQYYNPFTETIDNACQLAILPNIMYTIEF
ncbi:MAG: TonB-dependent receptor, partial [Bacteroidetes bacterium]|nr:TonB-dependent receptor [Bacteroidota bacterium]